VGFETQEDAERAWHELTKLPAFKDMPESAKLLQRAVFDYAWEASRREKP
jgi:hypothetical protein